MRMMIMMSKMIMMIIMVVMIAADIERRGSIVVVRGHQTVMDDGRKQMGYQTQTRNSVTTVPRALHRA